MLRGLVSFRILVSKKYGNDEREKKSLFAGRAVVPFVRFLVRKPGKMGTRAGAVLTAG